MNDKRGGRSRSTQNQRADAEASLAAMVRQGILKAREKLIDLTLKNGMLNYKHSETSSRHVRLVNESLEQLAAALTSDKSLNVAALPPVEMVPRDEDTDEFRAALKSAKTTDPEWLAAEDARRATGGRRFFRDKSAERALRDRVRAARGMPSWRAINDPKTRAQELGINPSYDLAGQDQEGHGEHAVKRLQTLFFPDRLEPKLSAIHKTARTLQEDAGISALYCALGFLEWYETDDVTNPAFAPLILLPINMEKKVVSGEYIFSVMGSGEDETTNAALREKLKRHHFLDLSDYEADVGVDAYLAQVADVIRNKPRWRIRRWATIGLFSFARQAMWGDLNPENWPDETRPEKHELLQDIFGDVSAERSENIAELYDVDRPDMERKAPAIIIDADASQLSAVIDVADGKNIVIQGPPGTGKSQAITNIIANAMWQGKSILFVSEKMAALKVVKDRLDDMKLGLYCLEVHSKTSKAQVMESLKARMQAPYPRLNQDDIQRAKQTLQDVRQRLTEYAALMNSPAGKTGMTTHEILWADFSRNIRPEAVPASALEFRYENPLSIDRYRLAERKGAGKALDDLCESLGIEADPGRQKWRGISNANLSRFDKPRAVEAVQLWANALSNVETDMQRIIDATAWPECGTISNLRAVVTLVNSLPPLSDNVDEIVLALVVDEEAANSLERWSASAIEAQKLDSEIGQVCSTIALDARFASVNEIQNRAEALGVLDQPVNALSEIRNEALVAAHASEEQSALLDKVFSFTGAERPAQWSTRIENMLVATALLSKSLPEKYFRYRSPILAESATIDELVAAKEIVERANSARTRAGLESNISIAVTGSQLRTAATVLLSTGLVGRLFSSDWKEAKRLWNSLFPAEKKVKTDVAAKRLIAAAEWQEEIAALDNALIARDASGQFWKGISTPFDALVIAGHWMRAVRDATPLGETGSKEMRKRLYEGNSDDLTPLWELADVIATNKTAKLVAECVAKGTTVHDTTATQHERAAALQSLIQDAQEFEPRMGKTIAEIKKAKTVLNRARQCRDVMSRQTIAQAATRHMNAASDSDKAARILSTVEYGRRLNEAKLPVPVRKLLFSGTCSQTLSSWQQLAAETELHLAAEMQTRGVADGLLRFDRIEWCGAEFDDADIAFLSEKVGDAANAPHSLDDQLMLLNLEQEAVSLGLGDLLSTWVKSGKRYAGVAWAVEAAYYRSAAEALMRENPILARHSGKTHEQTRERFRELDKGVLVLNRQMIAAKLHNSPIPPGMRTQSVKDYTDNQMLIHQTGLQKPRIALRRLFTKAGNAIRAYKPCVMMSPMSVAQYLEPGAHSFDILVVDEASQMRPEDSLGALLRCSQAVIVGDPEQLPPSDFFVASEFSDEEEADDSPEESILELGRRCWHPMRMLEVHYRSKHQSLIAYSNGEFYRDQLLVYPSPILKDPDFGVSSHRVDGIYERGQGRNIPEAQAVVDEAARLMRSRTDRSIGIVAVNQAQSDLIEHMLDEVAASDPAIQAYRQFWDGKLEAPFVKNLENVQGDERDIILISTVYGRTADGAFHQNFGPINKAYGHRRLNVLFTRAKRKLALFTSLDHTQILAEGKQRGVRVLKEFLEYAATGSFQVGRRLGQEPDSDFERWFLDRLEREGYQAHPQVGVAKYRIDIGVVHPDRPGSYILGVECDGATYHSSKAARDRDRLRQEVLEALTWKIHRVWSTDWYRDPEREFARLRQKIEALRTIQN